MNVTDSVEGWTNSDERKFVEMSERRKRVVGGRRAALAEALSDATFPCNELMLDRAIEHAGAIRDALEPFDSGVRCAQ